MVSGLSLINNITTTITIYYSRVFSTGIDAITIAEQNGFVEIVNLLNQFTSKSLEDHDINVDSNRPEVVRLDVQRDELIASSADVKSQVGSKTNDYRRRKFKPATSVQSLAPLVVQNRLQSSKSADYAQNYGQQGDNKNHVTLRQSSYSAGTSDKYHVICDVSEKLRYQTEQFDDQYLAEDERSESTVSGQSDAGSLQENSIEKSKLLHHDDDAGTGLQDEGYAEHPAPNASHRKPSISLPDLRNKRTPPSVSTYSDSGYDTRSGRTTTMREELSLPEIPEPDSSSNEDDYTPRTRRDSLSLPDLRGLRRCLVGSPSALRNSPRLNTKQLANAALVDIRKNEVIKDDDFETIALNTGRRPDDASYLMLPKVQETNAIIADALSLPTSNKYKAWGTPRPNNTPRAPTMTELNKKIANRHKVLTDIA